MFDVLCLISIWPIQSDAIYCRFPFISGKEAESKHPGMFKVLSFKALNKYYTQSNKVNQNEMTTNTQSSEKESIHFSLH